MSGRPAKRRRPSSGSDADGYNTVYSLNIRRSSRRRRQSKDFQEASTSHESQNSTSQSSDEQKSNNQKDGSDCVLSTCRLRHGLNDDCLCEIFNYLGVYDLIQLCELDIYYQNLIIKWIIGKKLVNFDEMGSCWSTKKIFKVFGEKMRKIKIAEENTTYSFEHFLNFIIKSCSMNRLTEIKLRYSWPNSQSDIMNGAMAFFSNLRKLVLYGNDRPVTYNQFLTGISTVAVNLTHLTLRGVNVSGEWLLMAGGMENLRELRLHRSMSIQTNELSEFLRTKSKLELFSYIGNDDICPVFDTLIEHCPQLNTFFDFHSSNPYRPETSTITEPMKHRYDSIWEFDDLKVIGLTSYTQCGSDLYYPMIRMAGKKIAAKIEELKFYIDRDQTVVLPEPLNYTCKSFDSFSSLKAVELQVRSYTSEPCELNAEFICESILKLKTVKKFIVMSNHKISGINRVIDLAPNLEELDVAQMGMRYLPVEMRKIVKSIRRRRDQLIAEGQSDPKPFHVMVNDWQWRELQVYKDRETILTTGP